MCVFVSYRLIVAGYIATWWLLSMFHFDHQIIPYVWPVYLTNWSYTLLTCHLLLSAVIVLLNGVRTAGCHCCGQTTPFGNATLADDTRRTSYGTAHVTAARHRALAWYVKLDWLLYEMSSVAAICVSIIYFTALYPQLHTSGPPGLEDFHLHGVNSIVVVLEVCLSAIPVRYTHVVYSIAFGIAYTVFSILFWIGDNSRVIYPKVLDWNNPALTTGIAIGLIFIGIPLIHAVIFVLYKIRLAIYKKVYKVA